MNGGHIEVAQVLILHGADVEARDNFGETPLLRLARSIYFSLAKQRARLGDQHAGREHQEGVTLVEMLIAEGADVNTRNDDGKTPLHMAAIRGNYQAVKFFVDHGAEVLVFDKSGWTPRGYASVKHHTKIVNFPLSREKSRR